MKYLLIKNWDVYQPTGRYKAGSSLPWIKDWTDKEFDSGFMNLTFFQRYVYDALCRMRGRLGYDIPYDDPKWIARLLHANKRDASHIPAAILTLIEQGFLIVTLVNTEDAQGTQTGRTRDAEGTHTARSRDAQGTQTAHTRDADEENVLSNQQVTRRDKEEDIEREEEELETDREGRLSATFFQPLQKVEQGVFSKSGTTDLGDE